MLWTEFKSMVDDLLGVERRRLGVQPFIDRQIRLGVGNVQRLIDYYRRGIRTTYDYDDVSRDGFSSKIELPRSAALRELYHIKTGKIWVRRPLHEYPFSNRDDLRNGVVGLGQSGGYFRYAIDPRDGGKTAWVYPMVTRGYAVQVVWDALVGRSDMEYADTDEVPFDEPVVDLVYQWVKSKLAKEVDRDLQLSREFERSYKLAIGSLYSEVQERLRLKRVPSDADCEPCIDTCCPPVPVCGCGYVTTAGDGYGYPCPEIVNPQSEWVMFGDSGQRSSIEHTIAVATAVKALNPEFLIHLGDMTYPTTGRPGNPGTLVGPGLSPGGSPHLFYDLVIKHYWNFLDCNFYYQFGNHDLEFDYGKSYLNYFPHVSNLIGEARVVTRRYFYTFARGPVRFIGINTGINDDDPYFFADEALQYVKQICLTASEPWIVVFFHRPAYTSDASHHPGSNKVRVLTAQMRSFGVDLVVAAHAHNYERVMDHTGLMHVICGLGGATKRSLAETNMPIGSQMFYSDKYGFLHFKADNETLQWEMVTVDNEIVDRVTLRKTFDFCAIQNLSTPEEEEDIMQVFTGASATPQFPPNDPGQAAIYYHIAGDGDVTQHVWSVSGNVWTKVEGDGASGFFVAPTLADMKAIPNLPTNKQCTTMGHLQPFDDGGRPYLWDSTSTEAEYGIAVVIPNDTAPSSPGRWKQL